MMQNVLIIMLRYIGDVLLATPTARAIKVARPDVRVTMLVNRGTEDVLHGNPNMDEIMTVDRRSLAAQLRFVAGLRRRRFDTVIDLTDGDRPAFLSWFSGAPVRIGFNDWHCPRGRLYTHIVRSGTGQHRIDRDLEALKPVNIHAASKDLQLWLTKDEEDSADQLLNQLDIKRSRPIVILQPGARYWFKAWPPERFAELADGLTSQYGCQVLIGGSSQEGDLAQQIRQMAKSRPIIMAGRTTIRQFAAIARKAALFIGNDSGAMHIASAVGTPVVGLFGPTSPREWGPCGGPAEILYKEVDCRRSCRPTCTKGEENCMRLITVHEVYAAAQRLLAGNGQGAVSDCSSGSQRSDHPISVLPATSRP
ncbi:MAG TPA: putative lipopolysaccharide heptosyltransferase III [Nitrospiraceae bacterium]|nr:putative lipopolysaccharide heptosyltransferase III [Nitrospiraceae bacterium]